MSSGGQIVGGLVGAVVGFFASGFNPAGALYGAQIALIAGDYLSMAEGVAPESHQAAGEGE